MAASGADLLFLALPSPRKELFLEQHGEALGVPFRMGVGGSFDVFAGSRSARRKWMQQAGLEWSFRLLQEPRRCSSATSYGNSASCRPRDPSASTEASAR